MTKPCFRRVLDTMVCVCGSGLVLDLPGKELCNLKHQTGTMTSETLENPSFRCWQNENLKSAWNTFGHLTFYSHVKYQLFTLLKQQPCMSATAVKVWAKNISPLFRCNLHKLVSRNSLKSHRKNGNRHLKNYLDVKYQLFILLKQQPYTSGTAVKIWAKNI